MTFEELKKFSERMKGLAKTMLDDCRYIESDIKKAKDTMMLEEMSFCIKMHEYERMMPTFDDIDALKNEIDPWSHFNSTGHPYYAPVVKDIENYITVMIHSFNECGASIRINLYHQSSEGTRYKQFNSALVLNKDRTKIKLMFSSDDNEERRSAVIALLRNQDIIFDMMSKLVVKVHERYAQMLKRYNDDLLDDASAFSKQ